MYPIPTDLIAITTSIRTIANSWQHGDFKTNALMHEYCKLQYTNFSADSSRSCWQSLTIDYQIAVFTLLDIRVFRELLKLRIRGVNGSTSSHDQGIARSSSPVGLRLFDFDFQCPPSLLSLSDTRDNEDSLSLPLFMLRERRRVMSAGTTSTVRTISRVCPVQTELSCAWRVGVDHIDLEECKRRGIRVTSAGDAFSEDGADYAVGLLLDVLRLLSASDRYVRTGLWPANGFYPLGNSAMDYGDREIVLVVVGH
nr:glyoxylate/hydroxypyruvate reductase HPR3-like [Tanacetum cinerariifolium]